MGEVVEGSDGGAGAGNLSLEVTRADGRVTIALTGELDPHTAPRLRAAIAEVDDAGAPLVLDLEGVTFIDSSGLREILRAREARRGVGELVLRHPSRTARRLLEISGLIDRLVIE